MLKRLCMLHAIREDELDQLLRRHVFVDLHQAVRQAMRIGLESYGLKKVETLAGLRAHRRASDAAPTRCSNTSTTSPRATSSICGPSRATTTRIAARRVAVFDWLRAPGAGRCRRGSRRRTGAEADEEPHEPSERELLRERARRGRAGGQRALARGRVARVPQPRGEAAVVGLLPAQGDVAGAVARRRRGARGARAPDRSRSDCRRADHSRIRCGTRHRTTRSRAGDNYEDPESGKAVSDPRDRRGRAHRLGQARGQQHERPPGRRHVRTGRSRCPSTRRRSCASRSRCGIERPRFPLSSASCATICRSSPGGLPAAPSRRRTCRTLRALAHGLDKSTLVIQGPPGTGKTYTGARLIIDLVRAGKRVGVTALSHKAIDNLCREIEAAAVEEDVHVRRHEARQRPPRRRR